MGEYYSWGVKLRFGSWGSWILVIFKCLVKVGFCVKIRIEIGKFGISKYEMGIFGWVFFRIVFWNFRVWRSGLFL